MFLRSLSGAIGILFVAVSLAGAQSRELRVCADPSNMPFSNKQEQGFENRLASLVAENLGAHLSYVWQRMGRGFVREYLNNSRCDLLIGIPEGFRPVLTTDAYYRSSYVFVTRRDAQRQIDSLNSPQLRGIKIGVQVLDENYTPPGEALARRGLQSEIVGFDTTDKPASIVEAVAQHQVDAAIAWGPLAGYFAREYGSALQILPVEPEVDPPGLPFTFAIAMGVRKGNFALRDELNKILAQHQREVRSILAEYGIPQLPLVTDQAKLDAIH